MCPSPCLTGLCRYWPISACSTSVPASRCLVQGRTHRKNLIDASHVKRASEEAGLEKGSLPSGDGFDLDEAGRHVRSGDGRVRKLTTHLVRSVLQGFSLGASCAASLQEQVCRETSGLGKRLQCATLNSTGAITTLCGLGLSVKSPSKITVWFFNDFWLPTSLCVRVCARVCVRLLRVLCVVP